MDLISQAKTDLRAQMKGKCRVPVTQAASEAAQQRLLESELVAGVRVVALYRALPSEIGTELLERELRARGVNVCLPIVDAAARILLFAPAGGPMERGALGIEQPKNARPIPLDDIDLFVLPGLAFDLEGHRLGRGRGHYDATLAAAPQALRVGLCSESSLVGTVPVGDHDQRLDALCTEARLVLCPPRLG